MGATGIGGSAGLWVLNVLLGMRGDVRVSFMHSGRGSVGHTRLTIRVKINPVKLPGTSLVFLPELHNDIADLRVYWKLNDVLHGFKTIKRNVL